MECKQLACKLVRSITVCLNNYFLQKLDAKIMTVGNEQEKERDTINSVIDDRVNHELYLWPFAEAVKANVTSVMCSYNKFGGSWSCESNELLTSLLKNELDFQGYVMSDWAAQHTTVGSANAGLVSLSRMISMLSAPLTNGKIGYDHAW